jgi:stearoyl-CoA desaturase (delta-9 desaturase)
MPAVQEEWLAFSEERVPANRRMAIDSSFLHRMQRRHFIFFNILPFIGSLVAIVVTILYGVSIVDVGLFLTMWMLTGLGISVGFHRLLCHRSFRTYEPVKAVLAVLGCMAAQGPVVSWVAMHRRHHQIADKEGDVHSPNLHGQGFAGKLRGFIHAHVTWMLEHQYPNVLHYVPDLLKDRALLKISRNYVWWVLLGLVLPGIAGGLITQSWFGALTGFLWGGVLRMFVVGQSIAALNSALHMIGTQRFRLRANPDDNSRNNWLGGLLIWGEGWHNNHHAFPNSAWFGLSWYRIDFGFWLIKLLELTGLAWGVRVPDADRIKAVEV